ncbi:hypothetical protein PVK62_16755 [Aliivibrio sp. S3MY1]|uniref:hypothetical protein n=1 Tax=unclassified Aliivibrio TaxID=2645654 RepID=UPI0023794876|nr:MULTISPECIES: hypothetical protein [unclassified Aliivibrio]MDD9197477.1 hypothetical protein [Aliivibrio sp. S3MY1]MDD9200713.1 hypothetical protein [Aliivibrio sp. S2MY1]
MKKIMAACSSEISVVIDVFSMIKKAKFDFQQFRVKSFLTGVQLNTERMTEKERVEFKNKCLSEAGQKLAADFALAVTETPSEIILGAYALLFSSDPDFSFTDAQIERFVLCTKGLSDRKIKLFMKLCALKPIDCELVYPLYTIGSHNYTEVNLDFEVDEINAYAQEFFNRGLLLQDPQVDFGVSYMADVPSKDSWLIRFGISDTLKRYSSLLNKVEYLLNE